MSNPNKTDHQDLGPMATTVAHEFNNLLMGIQSYLEIIRKHSGDNDLVALAAAEIAHAIRRGKSLSAQLLRHPETAEPARRRVDFAELVRKMIPHLQMLAGEQIRVEFDIPDRQACLDADPLQLHHGVSNVVLNAIESMPRGGVLRLSLTIQENQPRQTSLVVEDSGPGAVPEGLSRAVPQPLTGSKDSFLGLSLSLADQISRKNGGTLRIEPLPPNGKRVSMIFPLAAETGAKASKAVASRQLRKLVLVEDDPIVSSGIAAVLELEGLEVVAVDRGGLVVDTIERERPDAVILDVGLPDMSGVEVYGQIAARWPQLPVLFSSGHADRGNLATFLAQPNVGFLLKPYEMATLLENLRRLAGAP